MAALALSRSGERSDLERDQDYLSNYVLWATLEGLVLSHFQNSIVVA